MVSMHSLSSMSGALSSYAHAPTCGPPSSGRSPASGSALLSASFLAAAHSESSVSRATGPTCWRG
jgi:hypothetical protein